MPAWAPRRARLVANANAGAGTIQVTSSFAASSLLMKIGTAVYTVSGSSGTNQTWSVSPALAQPALSGAYLIEATIRLLVNGVDRTGVAQNIRHREGENGELEATWEITTRSPAAYTPNMQGDPVPFILSSNETGAFVPFFGGHVGRVANQRDHRGIHHLSFTGRSGGKTLEWNGYGDSHTWPADTPAHTVVTDAISAWDPWISPSMEHVLDGSLQIGELFDGIGSSPRAIIDHVVARGGDPSGEPLEWYVRTDIDGAQKFWLVLRGRNPLVTVPLARLEPMGFVLDYEQQRTRIVIKWQGGYVDESPPGTTGATRWRYFDYSTRIDNRELAQQIAKTYLKYWSTLEAISDGEVRIVGPELVGGYEPFRLRTGYRLNITGWDGGFPIGIVPIRGLEANHHEHGVSLTLGKMTEDELDYAEQFTGRQAKMLGNATSGLIPQNIAPPEGVPYQVSSPAASYGAGGKLGWSSVAPDAEVVSPVYMINAGYDTDGVTPFKIQPGRKDDFQIGIGGRVVGFQMLGTDGDTTTPGPGSISVKVGHGTFVTHPAAGTERTTLQIAGDTKMALNLDEPTTTPALNTRFPVEPTDYLSFEVLDDVPDEADRLNRVAIMILIQRTQGSAKGPSTGAPVILGQSHTRDATSGQSLFSVTTDRPSHVQIQYGEDTTYKSKSRPYEVLSTAVILREKPITSPFHWRVIATDDNGHVTTGDDQLG